MIKVFLINLFVLFTPCLFASYPKKSNIGSQKWIFLRQELGRICPHEMPYHSLKRGYEESRSMKKSRSSKSLSHTSSVAKIDKAPVSPHDNGLENYEVTIIVDRLKSDLEKKSANNDWRAVACIWAVLKSFNASQMED
ncbi:MAG: hypothetical protein UR26_C0003G0101 [candidate division TM6 bacterium GW2011_GWF2_32_72]|nr:MAG: hypothetical protein UR26_C0003G0101 [candidate division TM6 bacterium GW2011_GWF2_32_72]